MDDSVIKVLRRNGNWKKANQKKSFSKEEKISFDTNDFSLDEKFGVLAQEIKNRMKLKNSKTHGNDISLKEKKNNQQSILVNKELDEVKKKLLPYLIELEDLANKKNTHLSKIKEIDQNLEVIKDKITIIKADYEIELESMKKNLDFFSNSLNVINTLMENKK